MHRLLAAVTACLCGLAHGHDVRSTIAAVGAPYLLRCSVSGSIAGGALRALLEPTPLSAQPSALQLAWAAHVPGARLQALRVDCMYAADPQSHWAHYVRIIDADDAFWRTLHGDAVHPTADRPLKLFVQLLRPRLAGGQRGAPIPALWGYGFRVPIDPLLGNAAYKAAKARYVRVLPMALVEPPALQQAPPQPPQPAEVDEPPAMHEHD